MAIQAQDMTAPASGLHLIRQYGLRFNAFRPAVRLNRTDAGFITEYRLNGTNGSTKAGGVGSYPNYLCIQNYI